MGRDRSRLQTPETEAELATRDFDRAARGVEKGTKRRDTGRNPVVRGLGEIQLRISRASAMSAQGRYENSTEHIGLPKELKELIAENAAQNPGEGTELDG